MPPNPAPDLIKRLVDVGITESAALGSGQLSWLTIDAWQRNTAVVLAPWEARLLRHLSREYLAESQRAESENCPPPWRAGVVTDRERELEHQTLKDILG